MRCLNCTAEAEYKVINTSSADQVFCANHIPGFLKTSKEFANRIQPLVQKVEESKEVKAKKKKVSTVTKEDKAE